MTISEARNHIGRPVVHHPEGGKPRNGMITSVGSWKVFVCYRRGALARPADPADLILAEAVAR